MISSLKLCIFHKTAEESFNVALLKFIPNRPIKMKIHRVCYKLMKLFPVYYLWTITLFKIQKDQ